MDGIQRADAEQVDVGRDIRRDRSTPGEAEKECSVPLKNKRRFGVFDAIRLKHRQFPGII